MTTQKTKNQLSSFLKSGSLLSVIIIVCTAMWLLTLLFPLVDYLYALPTGTARAGWMHWLALSSDWSSLLSRPWTLLTHLFVHNGLWHILFNMVMLYFGGTLCCRYLGDRRLPWIYFLSGIVGGLLYLLLYNVFPISRSGASTIVGASAAVLGVFVAVAAYVPNQEVMIWPFKQGVKIKYVAIAFIVVDLLAIPASNAGGHIAHLGGALTGWLSVVVMRAKAGNFLKSKPFQHKKNSKNNSTGGRPISDEEYNRRRANEQKRIDEILDKISKYGYDRLTKEEKEILFRNSK